MLKVGLCGWTIGQREYVERFPLVEVQQTFYDPPAETTLRRWRETTPETFEFTLKAWQLITHEPSSSTYRRMRRSLAIEGAGSFRATPIVEHGWDVTLRCARILRATAVLFQCPRSFRPTEENVQQLRRFFASRDRKDMRFLWEPRGAWPMELLRELCEELELVHVVDPFVNERVTDSIYFRLHGTTGSRHVYTDAELQFVATQIEGAKHPYVMFNNIPRVTDSERFLRLVAAARG